MLQIDYNTMFWIPLSIFRSFVSANLIMYLKTDNTPKFIFPIIINMLVGILCAIYFMLFYSNHIAEFYKPKYYIYSIFVFFLILLTYYIIKICPNPAYFRAFVSLEIMIILTYTFYLNDDFKISKRGIVGIILDSIGLVLLSFN